MVVADLTDPRTILSLLSTLFMLFSVAFGMVKFYQKGNLILSAEWGVMTLSLSNITMWIFTQWQWQMDFVMYLDAFSRVAGMNLLVVFGFLAVTHSYKPSVLSDVVIFVGIGVLAAMLMYVDFLDPFRPYVFFAVYFMFLPFLLMLAWELFSLGEKTLGMHMVVTSLLFTYIHSIADFYPIPGDATNLVYNYVFMALMVWGYGYLVIYFSYVALERHIKASQADTGRPVNTDREALLGSTS